MEVTIERASLEDVDALLDAQNAAFRPDFEKYGECPSYIEEREIMIKKVESAVFYKILLHNGEIVGGLEIYPRNDFHYHLYAISVHPKYQNMGIGTRVIKLMLEKHPEVVIWSLVTPSDNPQTRHLYEKIGFVVSGEIKSPGGVSLTIYELLVRRPEYSGHPHSWMNCDCLTCHSRTYQIDTSVAEPKSAHPE